MIDFLTKMGPGLAYFILFLGSLVEGESIVLTAGFLSYTGFLDLKWVMIIAFLATLFADQTLFMVGYYRGAKLLARHPNWENRVQKIFRLLHQYDVWFILSFRFIYGIRTLTPLVIGAAQINFKKFLILNLIAAILWTGISCTAGYILGYFFADNIEDIFHKIGHYQKVGFFWVAGVLVVGGAVLYGYKKYKKSEKIKKDN